MTFDLILKIIEDIGMFELKRKMDMFKQWLKMNDLWTQELELYLKLND